MQLVEGGDYFKYFCLRRGEGRAILLLFEGGN